MQTLDRAMEDYARIDRACKERARLYALQRYHLNKDGNREARRENYRRTKAAETPAERNARLARRRELYRKRKNSKQLAGATPGGGE